MAKKQLNRTQSSFSDDPKQERVSQIRRDNDIVKFPKCTIEDIDWAIISHLQDVVKLSIVENDRIIPVPVMYGNGEKWAQVQANGYMRDQTGKLLTPAAIVKRNSIVERDTLKGLTVNNNPDGNEIIYQKNKFSSHSRYDLFSKLTGEKRKTEFYIAPVPEFIDVSYDLVLWTEYTEQLNSIVETLVPLSNMAWGTSFKFFVSLQDVSFETINSPGEDRVVKASIPLNVKGTLAMPFELNHSNLQRRFSIKKINFKEDLGI